jgi:hypothetical protein
LEGGAGFEGVEEGAGGDAAGADGAGAEEGRSGAPAENGPEIDDPDVDDPDVDGAPPPWPGAWAPAASAHADSRVARTRRAAAIIRT